MFLVKTGDGQSHHAFSPISAEFQGKRLVIAFAAISAYCYLNGLKSKDLKVGTILDQKARTNRSAILSHFLGDQILGSDLPH